MSLLADTGWVTATALKKKLFKHASFFGTTLQQQIVPFTQTYTDAPHRKPRVYLSEKRGKTQKQKRPKKEEEAKL